MIDQNLIFDIIYNKNGYYDCYAKIENIEEPICHCKITITKDVWTITEWFTKENYKHRGIGKITMKKLFQYLSNNLEEPQSIEYVWNGANEYVYNWINKNFDAICKCPIAVIKKQIDDDWESHIYVLNKEKVFSYFLEK